MHPVSNRIESSWPAVPADASGGAEPGLSYLLLMDRTVDLLIAKAMAGELWPEAYERAVDVLEAIPLPTGDFRLAARRLRNALSYASENEHGAAAFELRMLRGLLAG